VRISRFIFYNLLIFYIVESTVLSASRQGQGPGHNTNDLGPVATTSGLEAAGTDLSQLADVDDSIAQLDDVLLKKLLHVVIREWQRLHLNRVA